MVVILALAVAKSLKLVSSCAEKLLLDEVEMASFGKLLSLFSSDG